MSDTSRRSESRPSRRIPALGCAALLAGALSFGSLSATAAVGRAISRPATRTNPRQLVGPIGLRAAAATVRAGGAIGRPRHVSGVAVVPRTRPSTSKVRVLVSASRKPERPRVVENPESVETQPAAIARFVARASGRPAPSVRWQRRRAGGRRWSYVAGADAAILSVIASGGENGDRYRAIFANRAGTATTRPAVLRIVPVLPPPPTVSSPASEPPSIVTQPSDETAIAGSTASFSASATGTPVPTVQWYGSTDGGSSWISIAGATSDTYTFIAGTTNNGDEFEAVYTNSAGAATTLPATLTVPSPDITITQQPTDEIVTENALATFTASATGSPTPTVQWQVSSDGGTTFAPIAGANAPVYSVTATTDNSGYEYEAVFTNSYGTVVTSPALLAVSAADASSQNWSGYVATGGTFTAVSGSWTVPTVSCSDVPEGSTSVWVGIDGDGNDTVEQDGTESDCVDGAAQYYAWYEMYGDNSVNDGDEVLLDPATYPVFPGDLITASVRVAGGLWTLTVADASESWSFSTEIGFAYASQSSAEWIVERPEVCDTTCALTTLARFNTVEFSDATATITSAEPISWYADADEATALEMVSNTGSVLDVPGPLDSSGEDFPVTWVAS